MRMLKYWLVAELTYWRDMVGAKVWSSQLVWAKVTQTRVPAQASQAGDSGASRGQVQQGRQAEFVCERQPHGSLAQDERERKWRVQAVSVSPASFQNRRSLPAAWRGLRDAELSAVSGIPGLVFVHASGFIGGADTQEAAVKMARRALVAE